ncbi:C-5 cytosine-specific DNA methylase [Calothrix parasitica NIES-267]|uniref:C-5 cytosine-specific DNA methylase n=1 Tax=Calothrix parasitica NIES-267 TaxID=1973488 RepID=A0A1Z4LU62_9CYAN|nr:C-5 cytosine-specific DNA methylase [Calothrix parasitica NIES-267]
MTMLFDIEQYQQPKKQGYTGDWNGVRYDPTWDEPDDIPKLKNEVSTVVEVLEKRKEINQHTSSHSSNPARKKKSSDRWYTPPYIVELVVQVLGEIDLDPCADDGKHISCKRHYIACDDGLTRQWEGRVFMNPPYSQPGVWMEKLQAEIKLERVTEAIALVPAATDTKWLSPVLKSQPVCFWTGRIKFLSEDYQPRNSARQSHVLVYWGLRKERFREVFEKYGVVYLPIPSIKLCTNNQVLGENKLLTISPSTKLQDNNQTHRGSTLLLTISNERVGNISRVLGENKLLTIPPSTKLQDDNQTHRECTLLLTISNKQVGNISQVLGENQSPSIPPSTKLQDDNQILEESTSGSNVSNKQVGNISQVLGGNKSLSISPSTKLQDNNQIPEESKSGSNLSNKQVGNISRVLGGNKLLTIPTSTKLQDNNQIPEESKSGSNLSNKQVGNISRVLGGNKSLSISPSTHRKHGEGSGNLFWGYANANSSKKKPVKQLYFEWEYRGKRGKTYVRSHLKERVISLNEAKVSVIKILKLLIYNPKVKSVLELN